MTRKVHFSDQALCERCNNHLSTIKSKICKYCYLAARNECASEWCPNKLSIKPLIKGFCNNCVKTCDSCKVIYHTFWMSVADHKICRFCAKKQRLQKDKTINGFCDILMKRGPRKGEACSRKLNSQGKCSYHK